ncbi:MAG: hypothetical protein ACYC7D_13865 [Nitrososphaerales archaeon]
MALDHQEIKKKHRSRFLLVGLLIIIVAGGSIIAFMIYMQNQQVPTSTTSTSLTSTGNIDAILKRIVLGRMYQQGSWVLPGETPTSVGQAIAKLDPTYVSGLIRLASTDTLSAQQIADYNTVRNIVLQTSPNAKFDVVLNANQYSSSQQIVSQMQAINSKIHVDIWFFDFFNVGYKSSPDTIEAAISYAHGQGQLISGNDFGDQVPPGSDFATITDNNFVLDLSQISSIKSTYGIPVVVHLNNNPQNGPSTESCVFITDYSTAQRQSYVTQLAQGQASGGYLFMYDVFFPQCPVGTAYDATQDGSMYQTIQNLMSTYNA